MKGNGDYMSTALDMATRYYDKRIAARKRVYYKTLDALLIASGLDYLAGRYTVPSWVGIKNIEITISTK